MRETLFPLQTDCCNMSRLPKLDLQRTTGHGVFSKAVILHLLVRRLHTVYRKIAHNKVTSMLTLVLPAQGHCQDHIEAGCIKPTNLLYEAADTY